MPNPVTFSEIVGPDGAALQQFYAGVFGWSVDTSKVPGSGYLDSGVPGAVQGGLRQETQAPAERILYISVPDLPAAVDQVKGAGGTIVMPPTKLPWIHLDPVSRSSRHLTGLVAT